MTVVGHTLGRCHHPLGSSGSLAVTCALQKGHNGDHRSIFSTFRPITGDHPGPSAVERAKRDV